jgi:hypothetical protein
VVDADEPLLRAYSLMAAPAREPTGSAWRIPAAARSKRKMSHLLFGAMLHLFLPRTLAEDAPTQPHSADDVGGSGDDDRGAETDRGIMGFLLGTAAGYACLAVSAMDERFSLTLTYHLYLQWRMCIPSGWYTHVNLFGQG